MARTIPWLGLAVVLKVGDTPRTSFVSELTLAVPGEQSSSDAQALQAPVHPSPHVARRGRGRPRRSRPAITIGNAIWEVTKIAEDE